MIYRTHENPIISAWSIDDYRLGACILNVSNLLTMVVTDNIDSGNEIYKWVAHTQDNFMWACTYAYALLNVYKSVFKKKHGRHDDIMRAMCLQKTLPTGVLTEFPTTIQHNRILLNSKWNRSSTWKNRVPPAWREHIVRH